jgi:hypothetical protein
MINGFFAVFTALAGETGCKQSKRSYLLIVQQSLTKVLSGINEAYAQIERAIS